MFENTWNQIISWFQDRSERNHLIRNFNLAAREAFVRGMAPTLLKAKISKGVSSYKHQFSAWINTGLRVQVFAGKPLSKDEMIFIGQVILNDKELVRRLIVLGWDTLEVHDDKGIYGCRWNLMDYANMGLMLK